MSAHGCANVGSHRYRPRAGVKPGVSTDSVNFRKVGGVKGKAQVLLASTEAIIFAGRLAFLPDNEHPSHPPLVPSDPKEKPNPTTLPRRQDNNQTQVPSIIALPELTLTRVNSITMRFTLVVTLLVTLVVTLLVTLTMLVGIAGPIAFVAAYAALQPMCFKGVMACYAVAGATWGATLAATAPATVLACNAALAACEAAAAASAAAAAIAPLP